MSGRARFAAARSKAPSSSIRSPASSTRTRLPRSTGSRGKRRAEGHALDPLAHGLQPLDAPLEVVLQEPAFDVGDDDSQALAFEHRGEPPARVQQLLGRLDLLGPDLEQVRLL